MHSLVNFKCKGNKALSLNKTFKNAQNTMTLMKIFAHHSLFLRKIKHFYLKLNMITKYSNKKMNLQKLTFQLLKNKCVREMCFYLSYYSKLINKPLYSGDDDKSQRTIKEH